jgi:hypothetical protein
MLLDHTTTLPRPLKLSLIVKFISRFPTKPALTDVGENRWPSLRYVVFDEFYASLCFLGWLYPLHGRVCTLFGFLPTVS